MKSLTLRLSSLALLIAILIITPAAKADAQSTLSYGVVGTSLNTSSTGAVTGTAFAVPSSYAAIITWTVVADGSALSVNLEGSNDNSTYFTIDSQTTATGGIRNYGFTSVKYVRCSAVSRTGGTNTTCTLVIARSFISSGANSSVSLFANGSAAAPSISFISAPSTGLYKVSSGELGFAIGGSAAAEVAPGGVYVPTGSVFGFLSGALGSAADTVLFKDAANIIAQRFNTNAQLFRVYNTFTDASNYERLQIGGQTTSFQIISQNAGTGVARPLKLGVANGAQWTISTAGHFTAETDNNNDIGTAGANRPRDIYLAGNLIAGAGIQSGAASTISFNGRTRFDSPSDGVLTLAVNAAGKFGRLQLGGTTSSFPSLKRNAAGIDFRVADDSAYANIAALAYDIPVNGTGLSRGGNTIISGVAPTISSGFGTSPSITNNNGTAAFVINVGTGGTATSGVIGLPTATTGWNCFATDVTATTNHTALETEMLSSTTTSVTIESQNRSTGAAQAWAASSIIRVSCFAY